MLAPLSIKLNGAEDGDPPNFEDECLQLKRNEFANQALESDVALATVMMSGAKTRGQREMFIIERLMFNQVERINKLNTFKKTYLFIEHLF